MPEFVAGAVIGGKYQLMRPLGSGSMGSIWAAWQTGFERAVAIKVMSPALLASPLARTRFEREMAAAGRLRTAHAVQLYDHGLEGDAPYLVMELLEGEDLGERLQRMGRLPIDTAAHIATQLAAGLSAAHEVGVIHRDLKPSNVFLAKQGSGEIVKVIDFGIARFLNEGDGPGGAATKTGSAVGSPHYMSPEQAQGQKTLDHRSDLWSFGVILFRAVTGQLPFPGKDIASVIMSLWRDEAPAPSTVAPDLGPEVDRFFARALARDPASRFQSADELCAAFAALARTGHEATPPPSVVTQLSATAMPSSSSAVTQPSTAVMPPPSSAVTQPATAVMPPSSSAVTQASIAVMPPPSSVVTLPSTAVTPPPSSVATLPSAAAMPPPTMGMPPPTVAMPPPNAARASPLKMHPALIVLIVLGALALCVVMGLAVIINTAPSSEAETDEPKPKTTAAPAPSARSKPPPAKAPPAKTAAPHR